MTPWLTLSRRDPARNMARFYAVTVEQDLFGVWLVVRHWGREGTRGQRRHFAFPGRDEAMVELSRLIRSKSRRGYRIDSCQRPLP